MDFNGILFWVCIIILGLVVLGFIVVVTVQISGTTVTIDFSKLYKAAVNETISFDNRSNGSNTTEVR